MNETDYLRGQRSTWVAVLRATVRELGHTDLDDLLLKSARLILEREEAIATLRSVCCQYGDNNRPDDLHLSDIIDKHLNRHLESGENIRSQLG